MQVPFAAVCSWLQYQRHICMAAFHGLPFHLLVFFISIVFSLMFPGPCRVFYFYVCFTSYKMGMKFAFTTFQRCENSRIRKDFLKKISYWNNRGIFTTFMLLFSHMIQWKLIFKLPEQLLNLKILFKLIWELVNLSLQTNMELCMEQM